VSGTPFASLSWSLIAANSLDGDAVWVRQLWIASSGALANLVKGPVYSIRVYKRSMTDTILTVTERTSIRDCSWCNRNSGYGGTRTNGILYVVHE
jgi:hypothetical protein